MMKWKHCTLVFALALAVLATGGRATAQGQDAVVDGLLFYSESCSHCHAVIDEFLPTMREKYGSRINIELVPISDLTNYLILQQLDNLYGVPDDQRGVPELFIGSAVMVGRYSIEENFEAVVDGYLDQGGLDMGSIGELRQQMTAALATQTVVAGATQTPLAGATEAAMAAATPVPATEATAATQANPSAAVYLAYLEQPGCSECDRVSLSLDALEKMHPTLTVERYSVADMGLLAEWLGERFGVPADERLLTPAVFIGSDYLVGEAVTTGALEALVAKYSSSGAERVWDGWEQSQSSAEAMLVERFRSFGVLTLVAAGLIDGVNPCAFATILFLVSYLALTGRGKRQIVVVGIAFTLGVFATYMLLGFGLYQVATYMVGMQILAKVLYGLTALLCLVFAALSLYDFVLARRGRAEEMRLKLPARLRLVINRSIRGTVKPGTTVAAAFVAGVIVSGAELVCTGQVYLPTIMFVASRPELRLSAVGALSLYNVAFITPLAIVVGFAAFGSGSERLRLVLSKHTATLKLLTALVLVGLAVWLASLLY